MNNKKKFESIAGILGDISTFLTILAAIPYELGEAAEYLGPQTKSYMVGIGVFSTLGLRLIKRSLEILNAKEESDVTEKVEKDVKEIKKDVKENKEN